MTDVVADGMVRAQWVPAIAVLALPTTAELAAGIHMTEQITRDGLEAWQAATARIDNTHLGSTHDTELFGTDALTGAMIRFKRQLPTDLIRSTLVKGLRGFIVFRHDLAYDTAFASAQVLEVFPVQCGRRAPMKNEKNSLSRYEIPFAVHTTPAYDAQVA